MIHTCESGVYLALSIENDKCRNQAAFEYDGHWFCKQCYKILLEVDEYMKMRYDYN